MSAITRTERGRVGTALIAAGALLLALASVMIIGVTSADATHNDGHEVGLCHWNNGAKQWNYLSNLQLRDIRKSCGWGQVRRRRPRGWLGRSGSFLVGGRR